MNNNLIYILARPVPRKNLHFWRWFRTIPIVVVAVLCAVSVLFAATPNALQRALFYPVKYPEAISQASSQYGVEETLICAVIKTESNWDEQAKSAAGAEGLMQMMPSTAQEIAERQLVDSSRYSPKNLLDAHTNIVYGTAYLSYLKRYTNSLQETIAAYNAGPGAIDVWSSSGSTAKKEFKEKIDYPETKAYLEKVMDAYAHYNKLYPQGVDG